MPARTRRRLLAALGGGTLAASAGCLGRVRDAVTSVDYPDPDPPTYRAWLPAPDALPEPADDHGDAYDVSFLRVADLRGSGPVAQVGRGLRNLFARTGRDPLGVADRVDAVVKLQLARATVLLGSFGDDPLGPVAERAGYRERDSHRGYALYERDDGERAVAASADAVLLSVAEAPVETLRTVIDARAGAVDRYHAVDDRVARLTAAAGAPTMAWLQPSAGDRGVVGEELPGLVGGAYAQQFTRERALFANHLLFEPGSVPSPAELRRAIELPTGLRSGTMPLDVTVDGRLGRVEFSRAIGDVADDEPLVPLVRWAFAHDADAGEVTVTHRAGDPVRPHRLSVRVDSERPETRFVDEYDLVEPGDAVTVAADPGQDVRVVWAVEDATSTLAQYTVPQSDGSET